MQAQGSLQSLSLEQGAPTPVSRCFEDRNAAPNPISLPLQCPSQSHVGLEAFEVALVVVFMVVDGGELGELSLPEHSEEALPIG